MIRFLLACVCVALLAVDAHAQCRSGQCSTPAAACVGGSCNMQAQTAVAAPLPVAAVPVAPSATTSRAVAKTRVGGPLAGVATRRAQRAVQRATRANGRSKAVVRTRVSAVESVKHDFVAAANDVPAVQQVAVVTPVVQAPVAAAIATAVVQ